VKYFCRNGNSLIDMTFVPTLLRIIGDLISQTVYESKAERKSRFVNLKCDLYLLRRLTQPTTVYDVIKKLNYPHSTAYTMLQEYLHEGIIEQARSEHLKSGLTKRYYKLTDLGTDLLEIVEKMTRNMR
jgi:predicted transcriptional regulator